MDASSFDVCSICLRCLDDPRILPCAHSFCLKCLESKVTFTDSSKCPKCQRDFVIPQGGLKALKKNEFIEQLNILKQISIYCDSCKDNQAVKFCVDCSLNYCSTCLEHHARIPATSNHQLQPATSTRVKVNVKKYSNCAEHSELMTLVCENCGILLCSHCLTLNHKNHNFFHVSDYLNSVKIKLGEHLKVKKEIYQVVIKNTINSEVMIRDNELEAFNLKKKIEQRSEAAKKMIDSIVASLNQNIDEELKQYRKAANDVWLKLYEMKKDLSEQIKTLNHQLENLRYENITETMFNNLENTENIPNYSERFDISFYFYEDLKDIKKLFGNLHKGPHVTLAEEESLDSNIESISVHEGDLYDFRRLTDCSFEIKRNFGSSEKYACIKFHKDLVRIGSTLIVDDTFFVSGICSKGDGYILKVLNSKLIQVYHHQSFGKKSLLGLTKSICGKILVNFSNVILHLFTNGVVAKRITLPFCIHDVLQLNKDRYVVYCNGQVCIVGDKGNVLVRHSYDSSYTGFKGGLTSPRCLAKDCHGNVYVYDSIVQTVFILDDSLLIKSSFCLKKCLLKMFYDEVKNTLVFLCKGMTVLKYAL